MNGDVIWKGFILGFGPGFRKLFSRSTGTLILSCLRWVSKDSKLTRFSLERKEQILSFFPRSFVQGLAHISTTRHESARDLGGRPGWAASLWPECLARPARPPQGRLAPAPTRSEAGEAGIRRRPRGPLPSAPHILCFPPAAAQEALSASHREGAAGEPGAAISVQSGRRRAREALEAEAAHQPSVCFYFMQQKVLFVEANRRWGLELGGGRKREKATSTTARRSSPELPRGGE